jgi:hypothetical protein
MFHLLIGIACAIFIWKSFKQWRAERAERAFLASWTRPLPCAEPPTTPRAPAGWTRADFEPKKP